MSETISIEPKVNELKFNEPNIDIETHIESHLVKIHKLLKFCNTNDIQNFAYGYKMSNYTEEMYYALINFLQKKMNVDYNNEFIYFYASDEFKRVKYILNLKS